MADPLSLLPAPFNSCLASPAAAYVTARPQLITQGAEALLFRATILSDQTSCALKLRPQKHYRHPTLDARLTRHRLLAEARVLVRCRRALGAAVPALLAVDWQAGWIACEWISGWTVRKVVDVWSRGCESVEDVGGNQVLQRLMRRVGEVVGRLHASGVVHGDLTTSNLMVRDDEVVAAADGPPAAADRGREPVPNGQVVIIDFGLGVQSVQDEDRAVDLYVLERAFVSTHPLAEQLFKELLEAYAQAFKGGRVVLKKLDEVRQRGRKKSMLG